MEKSPKERLGIFGGTFNPIHYGHLRAAEEILEQFSLSEIVFVPARIPPHKHNNPIAAPEHRLRMVQLAIEDNPCFSLSDFELARKQTSYSIFTVKHFREEYGSGKELFFLMGMDSFLEITTWKDYTQLFALTNIIVVSRPGFSDQDPANVLPVDVAKDFDYNPIQRVFTHISGSRLYIHQVLLLDISSSEVRRRVENQQPVQDLIPETIERYIVKHGLYQ